MQPLPIFSDKPKAIYLDHMGDDLTVVKAARISFNMDEENYPQEKVVGLLNYLARGVSAKDWDNLLLALQIGVEDKQRASELLKSIRKQKTHWTPFAHTTIQIRCSAAIPLRTQAFKHKAGLVENEESRRYITSTPSFYMPVFKTKPEGSIKQGSGETHFNNSLIQVFYSNHIRASFDLYTRLLDENVCPEQARFVLPQGTEVNWVWTGNLFAFANYVTSRTDPHAQSDGYPLAHDIDKICRSLFPLSWSALVDQ